MTYTKQFKTIEGIKTKYKKSAFEDVKNFIGIFFDTDFDLKQIGEFEYKIRFHSISTHRGLYHLFITNGIPSPAYRIFQFTDTQDIQNFNSDFSWGFDNMLISGDIDFPTMASFNEVKNKLETNLPQLMATLSKWFTMTKELIVEQIPIYLQYWAEKNLGFNQETLPDFINSNVFLNGWTPFVAKKSFPAPKETWYSTITREGLTFTKIIGDKLIVRSMYFNTPTENNGILEIDTQEYQINDLFDTNCYLRIDNLHKDYDYPKNNKIAIDFDESIYKTYEASIIDTLDKKYGEIKINNNTYCLIQKYLNWFIETLGYHGTTEYQKYGEIDSKNRSFFDKYQVECSPLADGNRYATTWYMIDEFPTNFTPEQLNAMINYNCLIWTKLNFLKQFHTETIETMAPYYWRLDVVKHKKLDPLVMELNPNIK